LEIKQRKGRGTSRGNQIMKIHAARDANTGSSVDSRGIKRRVTWKGIEQKKGH
jgi:hypothetical protein